MRERLTSSTGLPRRAFDNELLRVFAQYRLSGAVGTLGAGHPASPPPPASGLPSGHVAISEPERCWPARASSSCWRAAILRQGTRRGPYHASGAGSLPSREGLQGLSWSLLLLLFALGRCIGAKVFVTTALLIVSALTVMLSATIPIAVYAGLTPIIAGIMAFFWGRCDMDSVTMALMAAAAQSSSSSWPTGSTPPRSPRSTSGPRRTR